MAKVIFGQGIAGIKGKVGGSVFQRVRSFYVFKQKGIPTNPKSSFQATVRGIFTTVTKRWGLITNDERKAWNKKADSASVASKKKSFGGSQKLSGKALFQEVNQNRLLCGELLTDTAPGVGVVNSTQVQYVEVDLTTSSIAVVFEAGTDNDTLFIISSTGTLSSGTTYKKGKFKKIYGDKVASGVTSINITAEYTKRFGSLPASGDNVSFEVRQITSTGYNDALIEPSTVYK